MEDAVHALRDWTPGDPASAITLQRLDTEPALYEVVASQQSATEQFLVAADRGAPSLMTGTNRAAGIHLRLDPSVRTFHLRMSSAVTYAWAGHWLVGRGASPDALTVYHPVPAHPYGLGSPHEFSGLLDGGDYAFARPGDGATLRVEDRIRRSGSRYMLLGRQMAYPCGSSGGEREANWALLLDRHPRASGRRFLLQLETIHLHSATYSITEGGFPTKRQAEGVLRRIDPRAPAPMPATDPATGLAPVRQPLPPRTAGQAFRPPSATSPPRSGRR
ncbi:hypothetical protein [Kitasatospora sp. A2-31]|uniref:hypothetical protein n=1 Tax=Kitasatospora sp. A2-31 TaxID=2916414 RepID=UPI001EECD814|nr:hypothetical protein [Kitasatospora sp. A2-31]MCG6496970.1 hypothetical protein [Kitasatospora sp. A2-31]